MNLIRPGILKTEHRDLIGNIVDSIERLDNEFSHVKTRIIKSIYSNIVLSGGASLTKGLSERIERDLRNMYSREMSNSENRLITPANRANAAWVGGSMMASIQTFQNLSIKRSEYEENGEIEAKLAFISQKTI